MKNKFLMNIFNIYVENISIYMLKSGCEKDVSGNSAQLSGYEQEQTDINKTARE